MRAAPPPQSGSWRRCGARAICHQAGLKRSRARRGVAPGQERFDIGCGSGGITLHLVEKHGADHATGFDVEKPVIEAARRRAEKPGLSERARFVRAAPGPLPFAGASFDVVF
ncbi:MAG TPA: class I SAM-dependent methyltransferase [Pseudaminobacter sp.]|nr:class I SAM-dependent methyltransferase [Pseudaminobacter sp.]